MVYSRQWLFDASEAHSLGVVKADMQKRIWWHKPGACIRHAKVQHLAIVCDDLTATQKHASWPLYIRIALRGASRLALA